METLVIEKQVYKSVVHAANELWEKEWQSFFPVKWAAAWDNQSLSEPSDRTSSTMWDLERAIKRGSFQVSQRPRRQSERTMYEIFRNNQIAKLDRLEIWINEFKKLGLVSPGL